MPTVMDMILGARGRGGGLTDFYNRLPPQALARLRQIAAARAAGNPPGTNAAGIGGVAGGAPGYLGPPNAVPIGSAPNPTMIGPPNVVPIGMSPGPVAINPSGTAGGGTVQGTTVTGTVPSAVRPPTNSMMSPGTQTARYPGSGQSSSVLGKYYGRR